jgi:hypothetical protein
LNRPQNPQELFNLRHASARNVIERVFGILKKRFPVLTNPAPYSITFQRDLVIALCAIHNFIRMNGGATDNIEKEALAEYEAARRQGELPSREVRPAFPEGKDAKRLRDTIAQAMWDDYVRILESRRQRRSGCVL